MYNNYLHAKPLSPCSDETIDCNTGCNTNTPINLSNARTTNNNENNENHGNETMTSSSHSTRPPRVFSHHSQANPFNLNNSNAIKTITVSCPYPPVELLNAHLGNYAPISVGSTAFFNTFIANSLTQSYTNPRPRSATDRNSFPVRLPAESNNNHYQNMLPEVENIKHGDRQPGENYPNSDVQIQSSASVNVTKNNESFIDAYDFDQNYSIKNDSAIVNGNAQQRKKIMQIINNVEDRLIFLAQELTKAERKYIYDSREARGLQVEIVTIRSRMRNTNWEILRPSVRRNIENIQYALRHMP